MGKQVPPGRPESEIGIKRNFPKEEWRIRDGWEPDATPIKLSGFGRNWRMKGKFKVGAKTELSTERHSENNSDAGGPETKLISPFIRTPSFCSLSH